MRNATVAALIYEFLFDVYRLMEAERGRNEWLPDEDGVVREAFNDWCTSCWEWSTSVLEEVGATKTLRPPPQTVLMHIKPEPECQEWVYLSLDDPGRMPRCRLFGVRDLRQLLLRNVHL